MKEKEKEEYVNMSYLEFDDIPCVKESTMSSSDYVSNVNELETDDLFGQWGRWEYIIWAIIPKYTSSTNHSF